MKKNLVISKSERERILSEELNMMKYLVSYKKGVIISEQTPPNQPVVATATTPAGPGLSGFNADSDGNGTPDYLQAQNPQDKSALTTTTTTVVPAPATPAIDFKSMGFTDVKACKATPPFQLLPKAKMTLANAQKQWKQMNCNGSKNCQQGSSQFNIELVSALCDGSFTKLMAPAPILKPGPITPVTANGSTTPNGTTIGGGGAPPPQLALGAIGEAQKLMPNIINLDFQKQSQIATWSQSPAGKYILSLPAEQREAGLDNLEKRSGDQTTRNLRKDIRTALGMAADTSFGRLGQGVQGAVQGYQQGVKGNVPPKQ